MFPIPFSHRALGRLLACLVWLLPALACAAACPPHQQTLAAQVRLGPESLLLVVHPSSTYDARFSSKRGVDEAVRYAKGRRIPVIYLEDDTPLQYYFPEDCEPDHWVRSEGGEVNFSADVTRLYVVGGHLELCLSAALHDILLQWARDEPRNRTVTFFMDGIYSNGKLVQPDAPFFGDFVRFIDIVTYGRPGGEHWPKLNLLETMGVILREEHELDYLTQVLPRWDTTFPENYRVELQLNDSVKKVLRSAPGWHPPTVLFHFVDSAADGRLLPSGDMP